MIKSEHARQNVKFVLGDKGDHKESFFFFLKFKILTCFEATMIINLWGNHSKNKKEPEYVEMLQTVI